MTPQCTYDFLKELNEHLQELGEAFYYEDGRVITEKDFSTLVERSEEFKTKLNEILDICIGDMYGRKVTTELGDGKVVSYGLSGKSGRDNGALVYEVLIGDKEHFFYDYELTLV